MRKLESRITECDCGRYCDSNEINYIEIRGSNFGWWVKECPDCRKEGIHEQENRAAVWRLPAHRI